jgi:hypothetical protein
LPPLPEIKISNPGYAIVTVLRRKRSVGQRRVIAQLTLASHDAEISI